MYLDYIFMNCKNYFIYLFKLFSHSMLYKQCQTLLKDILKLVSMMCPNELLRFGLRIRKFLRVQVLLYIGVFHDRYLLRLLLFTLVLFLFYEL